MTIDADRVPVENNQAAQRFEASVNGQLAATRYTLSDGPIVFTHTEVPDEFEGQGVGSKLVRTALDYARPHHLAPVPRSAFVKGYIEQHPGAGVDRMIMEPIASV